MGEVMKKIIRALPVPISMTGAYFAVRNNKKLSTPAKVGIVAGSGVMTFLIQRTIRSFEGGNIQTAPVDYGQIPSAYTDPQTGQSVLWDPDPLSKEIFENIEGYNLYTYPETAKKILALNNNQIKLLYNHYNSYYAKDYPTLTQLFANEWEDWEGKYREVVSRLQGLGLSDIGPDKKIMLLAAMKEQGQRLKMINKRLKGCY